MYQYKIVVILLIIFSLCSAQQICLSQECKAQVAACDSSCQAILSRCTF